MPNNSTSEVEGVKRIQLVSWRNCYDNYCFFYDPVKQTVSTVGHEPVAIPPEIEIVNDTVSEDDFHTLRDIALAADTKESIGLENKKVKKPKT